jgi:predicted amidohydrolase
MKIALAQLNYTVGDFSKNTELILDTLKKAENQEVDLVVFFRVKCLWLCPI